MCEFCTKHGDGKVWFKNAANYGNDLMADLRRRQYIEEFFTSTIEDGIVTLGRLETLYQKKKAIAPATCQADGGPGPGGAFRPGGHS